MIIWILNYTKKTSYFSISIYFLPYLLCNYLIDILSFDFTYFFFKIRPLNKKIRVRKSKFLKEIDK